MGAKRCGVCGAAAAAVAAFCPRCGSPLAAAPAAAASGGAARARTDTGILRWAFVAARILELLPIWTWPIERLAQALFWRGRAPGTAGVLLASLVGSLVTSYLVIGLIQWSAGWVITIPGGPTLEFYRYYAIPYLATNKAIGLNYLGPIANVLAFLISSKVAFMIARRGYRMWSRA